MSRSIPTLILVIIYVLAIALRAGRRKGAQNAKAAAPERTARPDRPTPTIPALARRRTHKDDCEYGEGNHQYSHASEKRVAQLKGYLEAGLIDKKEYAQMLERYTRQDEIYETYNR